MIVVIGLRLKLANKSTEPTITLILGENEAGFR